MSRLFLCTLVFGLMLVGNMDAEGVFADDDMQAIIGNWILSRGEAGGRVFSADEVKQLSAIMGNGTHTILQGDKVLHKGTHKMAATKSPKQVDAIDSVGTTVGATLGIYEITADGSFRVCFAPIGKDRPTTFTTTAENGNFVHLWQRAQAK